ncbi:MAG: ComEC/Rec2 family competence protein [Alphaproteobacteria bacterium]|nr:ComEC/Rec2 family competence protein [Alphaproteobacteria bacterium]
MSVFRYELNKILERENERFFLWVPVVVAMGILSYFALKFEPSIWVSLAVIETLIVLAYFWRLSPQRLQILGWVALFVLGFVDIQLHAYYLQTVPLLQKEETLYLKGYVADSAYNYRGRRYLLLDHMQNFDDEKILGKYRVTLMQTTPDVVVGDCVELVATVRPLMMPNLLNSYQFNRQQFFQGIKATGYSDVSVHKLNCAEIGVTTDVFLPLIAKWRQKIVQNIEQILPPQTAGIAAAIIAGERGHISQQQTAAYRDAGLAHFLAISGLHMGMIAGLTFFIIRWLLASIPSIALRYNTKKLAAVVAIIMSFIYLIISGGQISAQRAFIMTFLILLGVLCGRQAISMRMIAWAALVLLLCEPEVVISAGFQMSFAAVIMLVAFYEKHSGAFRYQVNHQQYIFITIIQKVFYYLCGIVVADFIASMATLPFVIYHFNRISLYTSLANLLAGPVIALWIMPAVLVSLILMPFGLEKYILLLAGQGIEVVNYITNYVSHLSHATYQIVSMPSWGLFLIVCGGLWLALWQSKWRHWGWIVIITGFLSVLTVKMPDLIVDEGAKTFAVKDNSGQMVILPNRGNYFTKQMWQEKLALTPLSTRQQKTLREIYHGRKTDKFWLALQCTKEFCLYRDKVKLYKKGGILLGNDNLSAYSGLSMYDLENNPRIIRVRDTIGTRYWCVD